MQSRRIRLGIVGTGFGARVLAPAFASAQNCELTAICATSHDRASHAASQLKIPVAYGDWRLLIADRSIDAVAIATPPDVQPEIALAAIEKRKHVFCEKPLAISLATAERLAAAAESANIINMVDFEFPEAHAWQAAKSILNAGQLGSLRHAAVNWNVETYAVRMNLISWKTQRAHGGGTLFNFVSHVFHYIEWLLGPIVELSARLFGRARTLERSDRQDLGDTFVTVSFGTAKVPGTIAVSTDAVHGTGHSLELYGELASIVLRNHTDDYIGGFELLLGKKGSDGLQVVCAPPATGPSDGRIEAVAKLANRFVNSIQSGTSAKPNFQDGVRVQYLLQQALLSDQRRCTVSCE